MKASEAEVLEFIKKSNQFVIPIYQRIYSWGERECRQLWDDILRAGLRAEMGGHFIGSVVYVDDHLGTTTQASPQLIIDGQQRLTTVTLILEALARQVGDGEPVEDFSAAQIRRYYLIDDLRKGINRYKLLLSQTDRTSLIALIDHSPAPANASIRIRENFDYFEEAIRREAHRIDAVCRGLKRLMVVEIHLERGIDDPQLIFESMNSTGKELSQGDRIRSFILMGLDPDLQERLYTNYWRPMEEEFGQEAYSQWFDAFMRHYLTIKMGEIPNINQVYEAFKDYAKSTYTATDQIESLVADIRRYSGWFCAMAFRKETDVALALAFRDLLDLNVDVAWPFLLELFEDYKNGILARDVFIAIVRLVESYVFRRSVCAIPTNSLNKTFATISKSIRKESYLESTRAAFLLLGSYKYFPGNEEFKRELQARDLYNYRLRSYMLGKLENHGHKERISIGDYSIEHIMPQNENLSEQWKLELGPDWKRVHEEWLHRLGNLTLTAYNSEYSNRSFADKRDREKGFRQSHLALNQGLAAITTWNEAAIKERAERLAELALEVWEAPKLPETVLVSYRPARGTATAYSIQDHLFLTCGPAADLFKAFKQEVLDMDPDIAVVFLKVYVAFKAETNFVDVIPRARSILLSINLEFNEIDDPRGLCKNVSNQGHQGNGKVELELKAIGDLPYALGLVRHAFEKQMGESTL
jgi:uncharacterized protein with ParB-like and HNH nuclease domain/predicted transport protein